MQCPSLDRRTVVILSSMAALLEPCHLPGSRRPGRRLLQRRPDGVGHAGGVQLALVFANNSSSRSIRRLVSLGVRVGARIYLRLSSYIDVKAKPRGRRSRFRGLAAQARARGISISALLADLAAKADREAIFSAEREATRAEAADRAIRDEEHDWADAVADDIE